MMSVRLKHIQVYKKTHDDWYPNWHFDGYCDGMEPGSYHLVRVSFYDLNQHGKPEPGWDRWRVCVWGADDDGMEQDFEDHRYEDAVSCFLAVIERDSIDKAFLKNLGFVRA
jgi:hypothetical protein